MEGLVAVDRFYLGGIHARQRFTILGRAIDNRILLTPAS
jgi:hypothetical protein